MATSMLDATEHASSMLDATEHASSMLDAIEHACGLGRESLSLFAQITRLAPSVEISSSKALARL
jgi:hypothetical protein